MPIKSAVAILTLVSGATGLWGFVHGPPPLDELLTSAPDPTDAITREFSFFNGPPPDITTDAISREFSFFNGPPPPVTDAISREFSFFNGPPPEPTDAITRELSFFNGCTSDADCVARPPCTVDTCHNPCTLPVSDSCRDSYCTRIALAGADPPNCAIDARQPFPPNAPGSPQGWNSVAITFNQDCAAAIADLAPGDFIVQVIPDDATPPPGIQDVIVAAEQATLDFSNKIPPGKWTCVDLVWSTDRICWGYLPADANGDRTAAPVDILELIDCLNGVRPCRIWQCDCDRSSLCAPADILCEIDLLNGANGWPRQNGKTLPVCPRAAQ